MRFEIAYVDGSMSEGELEEWRSAPSDGVNRVTVDRITFQGHSLYWLRRDGQAWRVGAASFYVNPVTEIVLEDGRQEEVRLEYVPDLYHADVKLGWWWRGEDVPPR